MTSWQLNLNTQGKDIKQTKYGKKIQINIKNN